MSIAINPVTIKLPPELEDRLFFTPEEFGRLVGKSATTVFRWHRLGWLKMRQFSPKCWMVPLSELERYKIGEMMVSAEAEGAG